MNIRNPLRPSAYKNLLLIVSCFLMFTACIPMVLAAPCTSVPSIGNVALSNCTLTVASVTGADQANNNEASTTNSAVITLNAGAAVTINAGSTLATGSIVLAGGTVAIADGGLISSGRPLYITDTDGDGWASTSFSNATISMATASGKRRVSLMRSRTAPDCNDMNNTVYPGTCANNVSCTTAGVTQVCATAGVCQTGGGGCSGGSCIPVVSNPAGTDPNNECPGAAPVIIVNSQAGQCSTLCNARAGAGAFCSGGVGCKTTLSCLSIGTDAGGTNGYLYREQLQVDHTYACVLTSGNSCGINLFRNTRVPAASCGGYAPMWTYCRCQ